MDKNFCYLILILLGIFLMYQIWMKNNKLNEKMVNLNQKILKMNEEEISNAVEITKLSIIKEPIMTRYKVNTNHITNVKNSILQNITHPSRFRFKFNNNRYNLYELRIIKSERLVTLGQPFDLEIHLVHKNDDNIYDTLVVVFPVRITNTNCDAGLLRKIFGTVADIPENNNFQVYRGKIQTIDYNCFVDYLKDTEICYYNPTNDTKSYLITQKPILENKRFIKKILQVL